MSGYTRTEKILHRTYLSNYFISKSSLELEEIMFGDKSKKIDVKEYIFISGLARSGTTALMNKIFFSGEYASLQYSNMPMLLSPNLWKKKLKLEKHERAHNDGIIIDGNSPEEFDEYFWKAFLKDSYIDGHLHPHEVDEEVLNKYIGYIQLLCLSKQKDKYISKNNNNILRLPALLSLANSKVFILYRKPLEHAASLMKLHKRFSEDQKNDKFALDYFNWLGHHEFGLGHKPFKFNDNAVKKLSQYDTRHFDYWLQIWINYYSYLLSSKNLSVTLIAFEDLIGDPQRVYDYVGQITQLKANLIADKAHTPSAYNTPKHTPELLEEANRIYGELELLKKY
ncbi:sulfotransferase family protein [Maribacter sp. 2307UL18-2]|uniref:sulfotransferase family protein n=1 Tax=Maribacter sp. 2307UL18-2 TaxID=3386274 RepID=UPI0039BC9E05